MERRQLRNPRSPLLSHLFPVLSGRLQCNSVYSDFDRSIDRIDIDLVLGIPGRASDPVIETDFPSLTTE